MCPAFALENESDGDDFEDVIYFETGLCYCIYYPNRRQKCKKDIENFVQFYCDDEARLIRHTLYNNEGYLCVPKTI